MGHVRQQVLINFATLGFVGHSPVAPGTMGTLVALAVVALLKPSVPFLLLIAAFASVFGTIAAGEAEKNLGKKDPPEVVIDEAAGYFISVLFLPPGAFWFIAAFILFRIFDILKPSPVNRLQNLRGGFGIMADDIMAGIYANMVLQIWRVLL